MFDYATYIIVIGIIGFGCIVATCGCKYLYNYCCQYQINVVHRQIQDEEENDYSISNIHIYQNPIPPSYNESNKDIIINLPPAYEE